ncbi:hypothetical protein COCCADRAFT_39897 [Bipolaris zeicola 26-R-13]|uniref:Uncharacterized protein n=1 Tax=Cochliobolus carbonum (strain 26-R-13) TaxID=930089 RepID=W6XX49_COCC2|nr:uncharacterized protein COCCADRAFT_39897 [Bipolaris zeicola 26-R-13]EUC29800.1 hypothetical protein COCCADRAFT_39897 [Bipolaris zeicola 26-R-13]
MRLPNLSAAVALLVIAVVTGPPLVGYMDGGRERDTVSLVVTRPVLLLHHGRERYSQHRLCNPRYPE